MFEPIKQEAARLYRSGEAGSPLKTAERLMSLEGLAMHCPEHHFIVPAALLTAAHRQIGSDYERVERDLALAMARAKTIPGGACGNCGCCGAAIGAGIFLSAWLNVNPKSSENWSLVNRMSAACLNRVAEVEGPRCCKRVTYLALMEAVEFCKREIGLELEAPKDVVCTRFRQNRECRGKACPFFPGKKAG